MGGSSVQRHPEPSRCPPRAYECPQRPRGEHGGGPDPDEILTALPEDPVDTSATRRQTMELVDTGRSSHTFSIAALMAAEPGGEAYLHASEDPQQPQQPQHDTRGLVFQEARDSCCLVAPEDWGPPGYVAAAVPTAASTPVKDMEGEVLAHPPPRTLVSCPTSFRFGMSVVACGLCFRRGIRGSGVCFRTCVFCRSCRGAAYDELRQIF